MAAQGGAYVVVNTARRELDLLISPDQADCTVLTTSRSSPARHLDATDHTSIELIERQTFYLLLRDLLIFRGKVRLSVGGRAAACQSRRRTARPRWCNALMPHAVHQAGPAGSRVLLQVQ